MWLPPINPNLNLFDRITLVLTVCLGFSYIFQGYTQWGIDLKQKAKSRFKILGTAVKIIVLPIIIIGSSLRLSYKIYSQSEQKKLNAKQQLIEQVETKLYAQIEQNHLLENRLIQLEQKFNLMVKCSSFNQLLSVISIEELINRQPQLIDVVQWQKFRYK